MVLGIPKPHFFGSIFDHFLGPFPDPPLEGLFEPSWHAQVPVYPHKVKFGPLLGSHWGPKSTLGATRSGQKVQNGRYFFLRSGSRCRPGRTLCSKRLLEVLFIAFRHIWMDSGSVWEGFWTDLDGFEIRHTPLGCMACSDDFLFL